MANPLPDERDIISKIKKEGLSIDPSFWELINHHIGNELYMINLIVGATVLRDKPLSMDNSRKVLKHTEEIARFLKRLQGL